MGSLQGKVDFIVDQMAGAGAISARKMFGEYAIYRADKLIALVCDDRLFVKPTTAGRSHAGAVEEAPPYPGAKACLVIPGERWDDADWMAALAMITAAGLPAPAAKRR